MMGRAKEDGKDGEEEERWEELSRSSEAEAVLAL